MTMDRLNVDSNSRDKIVNDVFANFFVEAGAGSGKTTMLVSRMVSMVEHGIDIDKICAITFTKAAANEFYDRFQKVLSQRANPDYKYKSEGYAGELPAPTNETRDRCLKALNNIDMCFMGTIDSFCHMILTEHPTEAGIPSNAVILQDKEIAELYRQEYVKISKGEYGRALADLAGTFRSVNSEPEETFLKVVSILMNNRNVHFNFEEIKSYDIDKSFRQERDDLIRILGVISKNKDCIYLGNEDSRKTVDAIEKSANAMRKKWSLNFVNVYYAIKSVLKLQLNKDAMSRLGVGDEEYFDPGRSAIKLTIGSDNGVFSKLENLQYNITMTFADKCIPIIEKAIRDKGAVTFFDCLYYLRNMLKRDAEGDGKLIEYIYNRHSFFLIDEFQDTNPMQAEVFFYLSAKKPGPDWTKCVPRAGSMFVVGDPKQSIYRFRGADVHAFLNVKGMFGGDVGEVLELSRNFRSTTQMCDYYNRRFSIMLPEETVNQSKFEEIPLAADTWGSEFQGAYKYDVYTGGPETDEHYGETDTVQVGEIIERLVNNPGYTIRGKDDKDPRPVEYRDFMIISKAKSQLKEFMKYFEEHDIPYRVEGKVAFDDCPALSEIYNIYSAVADDSDQISLYAALTGKVLGLTRDELFAYRNSGNAIALRYADKEDGEISSETIKKVKTTIESLRDLNRASRSLSPSALFERIMSDFRVFRYTSSRNLEVVYYTLELLRNAENTGTISSIKDGAGFVSDLINGTNEIERCLRLQEDDNVVHLANLHKVKGLEAPIVILSYGSAKAPACKIRIERDPAVEGYIFRLDKDRDKNGVYISTSQFSSKEEEEQAAIKAEQTRLAYVGATRARNALILCNSHYWRNAKSGGGSYIASSAWKDLMAGDVKDFFEETIANSAVATKKTVSVCAKDLYEDAEQKCVLNDRSSEKETYSIMRPSLVAHSKMDEDSLDDLVAETEVPANEIDNTSQRSVVHRFPTLLGTITHRLMEVLVSTRDKTDLEATVDEILGEYLTEETASFKSEFKKALLQVGNTMRSSGYPQENKLPQLILKELIDADEVYCEVPFCYKKDAEIWNGVMDVIYLKDGKWHIVDYKTNVDGSGLDKLYEPQLNAYRTAFQAMTGETADAYTYHIAV